MGHIRWSTNVRRHRVVCVLCFLLLTFGWLAATSVLAQTKGQGLTPQYGGTYRRPLSNNPSTLDPAAVTDTNAVTVVQQIFDGLVQYDNSLSIAPALAETWKSSRDNLVWTFFLRKGVKFHNGRELVADDVVFSFLRILDPKVRSSGTEVFANVKGARDFIEGRARSVSGFRVLDAHTLEISLAEASAPFVSSLAIGYAKVVPREAVQASGAEFGNRPVGTGPFKFAGWKQDDMIQLEANPDYFAGRPFLDRLQYRIFPGQKIEQMYTSFSKRDLEDTPVPTNELGTARESRQHQFVSRPILGVRFFGFDTTKEPLTSRELRQAFNFAIDRDSLVQNVYKGRYKPGNSFLPPGTYGHDPQYKPYPYDPARARALLKKAGFPDGKGLPVFQIWSNPRSEIVEREHAAIRQQLAEVGIQVEFRYNTDFPAFNREMYDGKMPIFRYGWVGDVPEPENFLYRLFHSQGRNNMTRYRNPRVDRLLDEARIQQNLPKRVTLYREAERLILDDAPIIPLSYYSYERIFQPYVRSIEVSALGDPYIPMRKIWLAK
jgi:oligopeptide transport system substrate-binding protein